jgi:hypothetical protein
MSWMRRCLAYHSFVTERTTTMKPKPSPSPRAVGRALVVASISDNNRMEGSAEDDVREARKEFVDA